MTGAWAVYPTRLRCLSQAEAAGVRFAASTLRERGTVERAIRADLTSMSGSHVPLRRWLLPVLAAAAYPFLLNSYSAIAHAGNDSAEFLQRLALHSTASALMLAAFAVPCLALASLLRLDKSNGFEMRFLRRLLHIAAATPPLYVLATQLAAAVGVRKYPNALWCSVWVLVAAVTWRRLRTTRCSENSHPDSIVDKWIPAFRVVHGIAAPTLLLVFLAAHLANHLAALWSVEAHQSLMKLLRLWYRATWVEPAVLGLCVAMIATGLVLVAFHTRTGGDRYRTVQTTAGAYLAAFMLAHTSAVLWGRSVHIDTDWLFASGGPAGLLFGTSYYLIPYYPLAVIAVSTHIALGLRIVMLGHRIQPTVAARATYAVSTLGAVAAVVIATALLGVHIA